MIIISQDKTKIVNFDNIAHIFISKDSEKHYLIQYGKMNGGSELLGVYETIERAKEVLITIMEWYNELRTDIVEANAYSCSMNGRYYFKMPEE